LQQIQDAHVLGPNGKPAGIHIEPGLWDQRAAEAGGKPSCTNWQNQRTRPLISRRIMRTYLVLAASASLCQSRL
jgi:hypothetical protein